MLCAFIYYTVYTEMYGIKRYTGDRSAPGAWFVGMSGKYCIPLAAAAVCIFFMRIAADYESEARSMAACLWRRRRVTGRGAEAEGTKQYFSCRKMSNL